jgi:hypothetical protein
MSPLRFPENASMILELAYTGEANNSEFDKWLIHSAGPGLSIKDAHELFHDAMSSYNDQCLGEPESEWEAQGFLKPAGKADPASHDLQTIFEHHLRLVERQFSGGASGDPRQFYKLGFVVITRPDWRERGVSAVHCDKDHGKWKVAQCSGIPVDQLGMELYSVSDCDITFDEVRERFVEGSDNGGPDNVGGPAPAGLWQFAVFCSGVSQSAAEDFIPDPRGDPSYRMGEGCLWFLPSEAKSIEAVQEYWPVVYVHAVRDPTIPGNPGERRITRLHPSLFAIADDDVRSVKIVEMDWDREIERSDDELKGIGRESRATIHTCTPDSTVDTLLRLAVDAQDTMR